MSELQEILKALQDLSKKVDNLPTREELHQAISEQQKDVMALLQHINDKTERIDTQLGILNDKIFDQQVDIQLLKKVK